MTAPLSERNLSDPRCILGLDIGGTKILAGLAGLDGSLILKQERATRHEDGVTLVDQIAEIAGAMLAQTGRSPESLVAVALGVPAAVDPRSGLLAISPNLAVPADRPLAPLVAERLHCPVVVENDANLAAFGEATRGHGRGRQSLALISFGTGVGMGLVINGEIIRGACGRAGEISLLPLGADAGTYVARPDSGLFEDAVGSSGIRARYGDGETSVHRIFELAAKGDAAAAGAIEQTAKTAALGLASVLSLLDPDVLALAGSIGSQPEFAEALRRHVARLFPFRVDIAISALGREAGLFGAVEAALRHAIREPANLAHQSLG